MFFGFFIDIGEGFSGGWVNVSVDSFIEDTEKFRFRHAFLREFSIGEFNFFFAEGLFSNFSGLLFEVLELFIFDEGQLVSISQSQLGEIAEEAQFASGFNSEKAFENFDDDNENDEVLYHPEAAFLGDPVKGLLVAALERG